MPVTTPITRAASARMPASPMSVRPISVCFTNDRRGAGANARLTPFASDEKMPSAPHTRNPIPMRVIVPRDSIVASIMLPTVSASSGVARTTVSMMNSRAGPSPRK